MGCSIDTRTGLGISPQSYRMICRAGLLCWFDPTSDVIDDRKRAYNDATIFPGHLLSFFGLFRKTTGLTEQDLDTFVKEDILDEYGAEAFLSRFTRLLSELCDMTDTDNHFDNLSSSLENVGRIVVYPAFRQHYTSSGFVRALCDLADDPRLRLYTDSIKWGVHRSILTVFEYVSHLFAYSDALT